MKLKRIVIKIGTNVLHRSNGKLDYKLITEIAEQISPFDKSVANALANENRKQNRIDAGG